MTKQRFLVLLELYKTNQLSGDNLNEWLEAIQQEEYRLLLDQAIRTDFDNFDISPHWNKEKKAQVLDSIRTATGMHVPDAMAPPHRRRTMIKKYGWAAAVLIILAGSYYILNRSGKRATPPAVVSTTPAAIKAPQTSRAVITLSNGQQVFLDSVANGAVASQGNVQVTKLAGGQIAYSGTTAEIAYNTLTNPKGSRVINMRFADGSRVWLNAGSTLVYPVAFTDNERKVEISGEAYFEVEKDAQRPFIVKKNETTVTVLGTGFNVNAYDDEESLKVTLLEGSVKVVNRESAVVNNRESAIGNRQSVVLKPGQQAVITHDSRLTIDVEADTSAAIAWKNERFLFGEKAEIGAVMRQISRWYDVDISYQGTIDQHLGGSISRHEDVAAVLKMLEKTGVVKFGINGRKVTVMPNTP